MTSAEPKGRGLKWKGLTKTESYTIGRPRQGGLKTNLALIAGRKKQEEA